MDYAALEPGAAASDAIRHIAQSLGLDPAHGVTVRLTGPVPLADEEFASLAQDAHLSSGRCLRRCWESCGWRSGRRASFLRSSVTTLIGLVLTAAVGLLVDRPLQPHLDGLHSAFRGPRRRFQHSVQRPCPGRAAGPAQPRGGARRDGRQHRPGAGAVGSGDRRGLLRLPSDQLYRRGRTRSHCRPRHDRGVLSQHRAPAGAAGPAAVPAGADGGGRLRHAGARRALREPASSRRAGVGARCGDRLDARCCRWCASTSIR